MAIKIVSLDSLKSKKLEALIFEEIRILQQMNHPNILRFHEALMSDRNCYIITELCNEGDLANKIREKYSLHERDIGCYITDICQGLLYLREMKVIHRDLKPANVFLHNGRAKIADFGLAKISRYWHLDSVKGSQILISGLRSTCLRRA